jgi:hypothetical protein
VNFQSLRRTLIGSVLALVSAVALSSCGGGGASSTPQGGPLTLQPSGGSIYAGVPYTIQFTGGSAPYTLASSEPLLLAVPQSVRGNSITVVANNPGVVDVGLDPNEVPRRSVNISVRDATGSQVAGTYNVLQNFLTSYGISFSPTSCPNGTVPAVGSVCAGGDIAVRLSATFNGNLTPNRQFRLEVIRGPFFWVHPSSGVVGNSVTVTSDNQGVVTAIMRVTAGVPTQLAVLRVVDVASGVYVDHTFVIDGANANAVLTAIPQAFTFTGPDSATCGTGVGDFFVFDGLPPYSATSSNPNVTIEALDPNSNPGRFRIRAINPGICLTDATVVVVDSLGARTTVTVNTATGSNPPATPPPPPLTVAPNAITLGCGQSGSVSIIGGSGTSRSASSPDPRLTATTTANTLTITRSGVNPATGGNVTSQVNVSDGSSIATVTVTHPATCS